MATVSSFGKGELNGVELGDYIQNVVYEILTSRKVHLSKQRQNKLIHVPFILLFPWQSKYQNNLFLSQQLVGSNKNNMIYLLKQA